MASQIRPKQRVLVRWNDDLDKSLLLFITHTCTEMGIKIPYDVIARRMGSTFTEGAIQQHIAKLRTKMAELNVVPVPGPPRRGAVTTRPSSVYAQKSRAQPSIPITATDRRRSTMTGASLIDDQQTEEQPAPVRKGRAKRRKTAIKRSESDIGESDEELEGGDDEEYVADRSNKRKRSDKAKTSRSRGAKFVDPNDENAKAAAMLRHIQQVDDQYEADRAAADNYEHMDYMEASGGPASRTRGMQFDYTHFNAVNLNWPGEEEEEETEPNQPNAELRPKGDNNAGYAEYTQDGHISHASQALDTPQPQQVTTPPERIFHPYQPHDSTVDDFEQVSPRSMAPPPPHYSSNIHSHVDFTNWPGFNANGFSNNSAPLLQSPYPNTGQSIHSSQEDITVSRNPSTISNQSTQDVGNGVQVPQTPGNDDSGNIEPSLLHPNTPAADPSYFNNLFGTPEYHGLTADLSISEPMGSEAHLDFDYNVDLPSFFEDAFNFDEPI